MAIVSPPRPLGERRALAALVAGVVACGCAVVPLLVVAMFPMLGFWPVPVLHPYEVAVLAIVLGLVVGIVAVLLARGAASSDRSLAWATTGRRLGIAGAILSVAPFLLLSAIAAVMMSGLK